MPVELHLNRKVAGSTPVEVSRALAPGSSVVEHAELRFAKGRCRCDWSKRSRAGERRGECRWNYIGDHEVAGSIPARADTISPGSSVGRAHGGYVSPLHCRRRRGNYSWKESLANADGNTCHGFESRQESRFAEDFSSSVVEQ